MIRLGSIACSKIVTGSNISTIKTASRLLQQRKFCKINTNQNSIDSIVDEIEKCLHKLKMVQLKVSICETQNGGTAQNANSSSDEIMENNEAESAVQLLSQIKNMQNSILALNCKAEQLEKSVEKLTHLPDCLTHLKVDPQTLKLDLVKFDMAGMKDNKWDAKSVGELLSISDDGLILTTCGTDDWVNSALAVSPIAPLNLTGKQPRIVGYFEVEFLEIVPGVLDIEEIGYSNARENSIWAHMKDRISVNNRSVIELQNGMTDEFKEGEVIGLGLLHTPANSSIKCFMTCNGELMGLVELPNTFNTALEYFPAVRLTSYASILANFGKKEWRFNPCKLIH